MKFYEWCEQNNLTVAEAERRALKNDEKFMKAYENFKRPAYGGIKHGRNNDNDTMRYNGVTTTDSIKN